MWHKSWSIRTFWPRVDTLRSSSVKEHHISSSSTYVRGPMKAQTRLRGMCGAVTERTTTRVFASWAVGGSTPHGKVPWKPFPWLLSKWPRLHEVLLRNSEENRLYFKISEEGGLR